MAGEAGSLSIESRKEEREEKEVLILHFTCACVIISIEW
jgi:hypothetical protein